MQGDIGLCFIVIFIGRQTRESCLGERSRSSFWGDWLICRSSVIFDVFFYPAIFSARVARRKVVLTQADCFERTLNLCIDLCCLLVKAVDGAPLLEPFMTVAVSPLWISVVASYNNQQSVESTGAEVCA